MDGLDAVADFLKESGRDDLAEIVADAQAWAAQAEPQVNLAAEDLSRGDIIVRGDRGYWSRVGPGFAGFLAETGRKLAVCGKRCTKGENVSGWTCGTLAPAGGDFAGFTRADSPAR